MLFSGEMSCEGHGIKVDRGLPLDKRKQAIIATLTVAQRTCLYRPMSASSNNDVILRHPSPPTLMTSSHQNHRNPHRSKIRPRSTLQCESVTFVESATNSSKKPAAATNNNSISSIQKKSFRTSMDDSSLDNLPLNVSAWRQLVTEVHVFDNPCKRTNKVKFKD